MNKQNVLDGDHMKTEYRKSEVDSSVGWFRSTDIPETNSVSDK